MSERAPYSRVYWLIIDDPKFRLVYDDDRALACWLRLLLTADQAWPASASIPMTTRKSALDVLVKAEIIDPQPAGRYRVHGLDAERSRRKGAATRGDRPNPPGPQLGPKGNPGGPGTTGLSLAEPSQDEPSTADAGASDPADIYWQLTGKFPTDKVLPWIDQLTEEYGPDPVIRYLADEHQRDRTAMTLMGRVSNRLRADARKLSLKERALEKQRIGERRRDPAVLRAYHNTGAHQQPEPGCPLCQEAAA